MFDAIDRTTEDRLRERVDHERLAAHVDALADLRRYPGSEDQWTAAEYVVDTLREDDVPVTLHTLKAYTSVPETAALTVTSPKRATAEEVITTAFSADTAPGGVTAPVVQREVVVDGDLGDVTDRIVFTTGLPTPDRVRALERADAAAVVFESPTPGHLHEMIVSPVWGTPSTADRDRLPELPVVELGQADAAWFRELVAGDDVVATVETETTTELTELPCPVARVDGAHSDRFLLLGNHIDSWHEGVTDNATAVAASMEVARVFAAAQPRRGLVVGFWPGHSMGRYAGSAWYADEHWRTLRDDGVGYLHVDLNGLSGADQLWCQHMAAVADEHLAALETGPLPVGPSGDDELLGTSDRPGRNSDQSFWGAGLVSLLSGARFSADHEDRGPVGGGWWWHTEADTRDKVDLELLGDETELYVTIASRVCNSPVLPHDYRATCEDIDRELARLDPETEAVDLDRARATLADLASGLDTVAQRLDAADTTGVAHELEDLQVRLGNLLVPALYTQGSIHQQEPALDHDRLPGLQVATDLPGRTGLDRRSVEITVTRALNRLDDRLQAAVAAVDTYLTATDESA